MLGAFESVESNSNQFTSISSSFLDISVYQNTCSWSKFCCLLSWTSSILMKCWCSSFGSACLFGLWLIPFSCSCGVNKALLSLLTHRSLSWVLCFETPHTFMRRQVVQRAILTGLSRHKVSMFNACSTAMHAQFDIQKPLIFVANVPLDPPRLWSYQNTAYLRDQCHFGTFFVIKFASNVLQKTR